MPRNNYLSPLFPTLTTANSNDKMCGGLVDFDSYVNDGDMPLHAHKLQPSDINEIFNLKWVNNGERIWSHEEKDLLDVPELLRKSILPNNYAS